jgi:peptidoglycan/xylan/chitin deacetylase (PgdA/CDA1 family)
VARISRKPFLACLSFLFIALLLVPAEAVFASQANVFVYHRFNDSRYPSTNITIEAFKDHLETLKVEHFTVLSLGEVVDRMRAGESLPQRCAVITVDDGYLSFLTDGWPLLKQYGYPATLFVSTDTVGGSDFMSWQDLLKLQKEGVEIGNHSASHAYLLDRATSESESEWRGRVAEDLERSQELFQKHLSTSPRLFAYPYGEFSTELTGLIREAGFVAAFGQQSGVISDGQDMHTLPRFPVGGSYSAVSEFRSRLYMKNLSVKLEPNQDTVIKKENPPVLKFYLNNTAVDERTLKCFVQGGAGCLLEGGQGEDGVYSVKALQPLVGRRSKYTVTASDTSGQVWYWYSQLWVLPKTPSVTNQSVPR